MTDTSLRALMLAYIGNAMLPKEREAFERRLLEEDRFAEQISEEEQDLLDDYMAELLSTEQRRVVEPWIRASKRRLENLRLTRTLLLRSSSHTHKSLGQYYLLGSAIAACLIIAVSLRWIFPHQSNPIAATATLHQSASMVPIQSDVILLKLERLRGDTSEATYSIHSGSPIRLQVMGPPFIDESRNSLMIRLQNLQGGNLRFTDLTRHTVGDISYLEVSLVAGSLPAGHYVAELISSKGSFTTHFQVVMKH